jgi:uncharacterized protein YbjT (DUF2867 family)
MPLDLKFKRVLVMGATGFVGRALVRALVAEGYEVRATTRQLKREHEVPIVTWVQCDVGRREDMERALERVDAVFFLVHAMGHGAHGYVEAERRIAEQLRDAAAGAGVRRIVYLGGVAPAQEPSEHLRSRLAVGNVLRAGSVPTLELRASMIIGNGSASWQIVRDLAMRLPAMILPSWTAARTCPIALDDVLVALVRGLRLPLSESAWYDIPGPETLSSREILSKIAALRGRRVPSVRVPFLSVSLSSWWLKLVTRGDFALSRQIVLGLKGDLLPRDARYWSEIDYTPQSTFEAAARKALEDEAPEPRFRGALGRLEEALVHRVSPKLARRSAAPTGRG